MSSLSLLRSVVAAALVVGSSIRAEPIAAGTTNFINNVGTSNAVRVLNNSPYNVCIFRNGEPWQAQGRPKGKIPSPAIVTPGSAMVFTNCVAIGRQTIKVELKAIGTVAVGCKVSDLKIGSATRSVITGTNVPMTTVAVGRDDF